MKKNLEKKLTFKILKVKLYLCMNYAYIVFITENQLTFVIYKKSRKGAFL